MAPIGLIIFVAAIVIIMRGFMGSFAKKPEPKRERPVKKAKSAEFVMVCPNCHGSNKIKQNSTTDCKYCGSPISQQTEDYDEDDDQNAFFEHMEFMDGE